MPLFWIAIYHRNDRDSTVVEDEATVRDIQALNTQMKAAGVRVFAGGLNPAPGASSFRAEPDGRVHTIEGPHLKTDENVGGFWILDVADLNEAQSWGRKASMVCKVPVEVRAFH